MSVVHDRREFLRRAAAAAGTVALSTPTSWSAAAAWAKPARSPNEKLDLGVIGVAGRGADNLAGVSGENIVALCDIDATRLSKAAEQFPHAAKYTDFRQMLDRQDLDAVVISTPDHTHAIPAAMALRAGLDVYCEKPLAHSVWEVRQLRELAAEKGAVTQMGTQIHAEDNYRRVVELIQAGAIGPVRRIHVWQGNSVVPGVRVAEAAPDRKSVV